MRILLAFKEKHTTYVDAVRTAIREYRPHAEVLVIVPEGLEGAIERLEPHLLVCESPLSENPDGKLPACIELSIDPGRPSRFRVGQLRWEALNPGIEELMAVVAETKRLISLSS